MKWINLVPSSAILTGLALTGSCLATVSFAQDDISPGTWYLKAHAGTAWYAEGKDESLQFGDVDDFDHFRDDTSHELAVIYGLGGGYSFNLQNESRIEVGLGWYGDTEHKYKGFVDQYGDASLMRDYRYSYKVQSQRLVLESAWYFPFSSEPFNSGFEGFVTAGIGMSWNRFKDYGLTRLDPRDMSPKPGIDGNDGFGDNTSNTFAWQIGAGVAWQFTPEWRATASYLYASNGKAEAKGSQYYTDKYETGDLTSHNLVVSLQYQF